MITLAIVIISQRIILKKIVSGNLIDDFVAIVEAVLIVISVKC